MKRVLGILALGLVLLACTPADYCDRINTLVTQSQTATHQALRNEVSKAETIEILSHNAQCLADINPYRNNSTLLLAARQLTSFYHKTLLQGDSAFDTEAFIAQELLLQQAYHEAYSGFVQQFELLQSSP